MAAVLLPLRDDAPGLLRLVEQILGGTIVYAALVFLFDIAALRTLILGRLRPAVARVRPS